MVKLSQLQYKGFCQGKNTVTVDTEEGVKLKITVCGENIFQIWLDETGTFVKEASYAVECEDFETREETWLKEVKEEHKSLFITADKVGLCLNKSPMQIIFLDKDKNVLTEEYLAEDVEHFSSGFGQKGEVSASFSMAQEEHFYGLGQSNDAWEGDLDRRGTGRDMMTGQTICNGCVTADIPITFFLSTGRQGRGYGIFLDNTYRSEFDMGKEQKDCYSFEAEGGELLYYFIYGPKFSSIIKGYTALTGCPSMLPLWAYGYTQSRCTYRDWNDLDEVTETMREKKIPMDGLVIDADWPQEMINFQFHERFEGKSPEKMKEHMEKGVKFMLSTSGPMIQKGSSNFQSGLDAGIFATDGNGNTLTCGWYGGELMDFTAPNMKDWLKPQLEPLYNMGVKAWWLDLIEPEGEPLQTIYQGGERGKIHNAYAYFNTKVYYEIQKEFEPKGRPYILGRTGTAGIQRYGSATWSGDVYCSYETLRAHCAEALNAGLSGINNWTCDTGGFISSTYDAASGNSYHEYKNDIAAQALLYERWMQFSCFTPICRGHHVGACEPYYFGELVENSVSRYIRLRYRLLPYIYSYIYESNRTGAPLMRPLVYSYQMDEACYGIKDEYLFGEELLVAPVLSEQISSRSVYFPEGTWIDYDYGYVYEGKKEYQVYAPQNRIPLFVKAGSIIPMAPCMNYTDEENWDEITLDIYPFKISKFQLYLDDGVTEDYKKNEFTMVDIKCIEYEGKSLEIAIDESNDLFAPKDYLLQIHLNAPFTHIEGLKEYSHKSLLEHAEEGFFYQASKQILYVKMKLSAEGKGILTIELENKSYQKRLAPKLDEYGRCIAKKEEKQARIPYLIPAPSAPCTMQMENFDRGGEGVAYHMLNPGNESGLYREEDVSIGLCNDAGGGYALSQIKAGEWLVYSIMVEEKGCYDVILRMSCEEEGASFRVEFDGKNLTGKVSIPNTGEGNWSDVRFDNIMLPKGQMAVKIVIESGTVDLNYFQCA